MLGVQHFGQLRDMEVEMSGQELDICIGGSGEWVMGVCSEGEHREMHKISQGACRLRREKVMEMPKF